MNGMAILEELGYGSYSKVHKNQNSNIWTVRDLVQVTEVFKENKKRFYSVI